MFFFGNVFGNRRRHVHHRSSLFGGGLLSTLLVSLAPILYRKYMAKKNAGRLGLREAYAGGSTEW
jgi:hypothetical protein